MDPKPVKKVYTISGKEGPDDAVTDADYRKAAETQALVLRYQAEQRRTLDAIRARLARGARDAGIEYYYDWELEIVRRRKEEREA